tara:strand:- start:216 stop:641 length:426 start_codon:yes stop_codon:yes gene_type:complete
MESIKTYEDLEKSMSHDYTMIKATASWCGPCKRIHPEIVKLAEDDKYEDVTFYEYDIDGIDDCPLQEHIRVVPTFLFFEKDKLVHKVKGSDVRGVTNYLDDIVEKIRMNQQEDHERVETEAEEDEVDTILCDSDLEKVINK